MTTLAIFRPAPASAAVFAFRAGPAFCASLVAANSAPRRPTGPARRAEGRPDRVTRSEIAALFADDLYATA
ncbi:MAG: hypothetical protein ACK4GO_02885 [Gemmobacter sp.]